MLETARSAVKRLYKSRNVSFNVIIVLIIIIDIIIVIIIIIIIIFNNLERNWHIKMQANV